MMEISIGVLDLIIEEYINLHPTIGYLVERDGKIIWNNVLRILVVLSKVEMEAYFNICKRNGECAFQRDKHLSEVFSLLEIGNIKEAKRKYYLEKLNFDIDKSEGMEALEKLVLSYCNGLQWLMNYYILGIESWTWFFPSYYGPFISDIVEYKTSNPSQMSSIAYSQSPDKPTFGFPNTASNLLQFPKRKLLVNSTLQKFDPDFPLRLLLFNATA